MYKEIKCLRCDKILEYVKSENLQLGKEYGFSNQPSWAAGALYCDIYVCPECGEFYFIKGEIRPENELVKCKWCCKKVDPSFPKCPICGHSFDEKW